VEIKLRRVDDESFDEEYLITQMNSGNSQREKH
jgi:hypothetical protein